MTTSISESSNETISDDVTNQDEYQRKLRREAVRQKNKPANKATGPRNGFLRVIGGELRSRKILFKVEESTRPMKDRTREAIFNLLGDSVIGTIAIDLFAGSGILAFESISRGALSAGIIEKQSFRASEIIENAKRITVNDYCRVFTGDAFRISHNPVKLVEACSAADTPADTPWLLFCCPPYSMWTSHGEELVKLIDRWKERCPIGSSIVIELEELTEAQFPFESEGWEWDRRSYRPATIAIGKRTS